jgi:hypothetical protein
MTNKEKPWHLEAQIDALLEKMDPHSLSGSLKYTSASGGVSTGQGQALLLRNLDLWYHQNPK